MLAQVRMWVPFCCVVLHCFCLDGGQSAGAEEAPRLAAAAEGEDWAHLKQLIAEGHEVDRAQPDGMTALHWAVYYGERSAVAALLRAGAEATAKTEYEITPLTIACRQGNADLAGLLLRSGADANSTLPGGVTPLMIAARTGDPLTVRQLLAHDAKIEATERRGQTAMMWAAAEGHAEVVSMLIEADADFNQASTLGFTPIFFAARQGHLDVIKALLDDGADVNVVMQPKGSGPRVPRKGTSPLLMAVESGHFELAIQLVKRGADPNDQRNGYSPLHVISWVRKPNRGENPAGDPSPRGSGQLTSLQFVRQLVALGADVNLALESGKRGRAVLNRRGATPFLWAARTADLELMKTLVELGADPTQTNADGCNAVMAAAGVGVRAVGEEAGTEKEVLAALQWLVQFDFDINTVDENRETAMHGAAYRCFPRVIEFLVEQGADPEFWNHRNVSGWTPMLIAEGHRPGSFKPSPETIAAVEMAMKKGRVISSKED